MKIGEWKQQEIIFNLSLKDYSLGYMHSS